MFAGNKKVESSTKILFETLLNFAQQLFVMKTERNYFMRIQKQVTV